MIPLAASALAEALPLDAEPARPTPALLDAWRQLHYAAQVASEVGKAWATPAADDSHSSLEWRDAALLGVEVPAARPFRATLGAADLSLALVDARGAALAERSLAGATGAEGLAWIRAEATRLAGEGPRQRAVPAPDLPPHPVAQGARFASVDRAAFADLGRLLAAADSVLRRLADSAPGASPVRVWPHHFDMATLVALAPDRSVGVGLATPDALAASGYWYVSPWSASPRAAASWPALPHGAWLERGGPLRLAALPLAEVAALGDPPARRAAVAGFLASAFRASVAALG